MTLRTPQCKVFFLLLLSSEHSGVPEDSESQLFQVLGFTPTLGQSRGATIVEKLLPDIEDQVKAIEQLAKYRNSEGEFGHPFVKASAKKLPGWKWWVEFGSECLEFQSVAQKVLSQISCASTCERNWSTYDFIHNKKRNRL
jgi:hypothetical protein